MKHTGIIVKALTEKGQEVIGEVIDADNEENTSWQKLFRERIERKNPYIIRIEHKGRLARLAFPSSRLRVVTTEQLVKKGSIEGIDFSVEVFA